MRDLTDTDVSAAERVRHGRADRLVRRALILCCTIVCATALSRCGEQPDPEPEWQPSDEPMSIDLDWERFWRKGNFALRQDEYQEGIEMLHRAADLRPRHAPGWDLLGLAYTLADRPGIGVRLIQKAIDLDPTVATFYMHLGKSYMDLTDDQRARTAYEKALDLGLERAKVYYDLGRIAERQDRLQDAIDHFEDAIEVNATFEEPYYRLGTVHEKLGDDETAGRWFEQAREVYPGHSGATYSLGRLYLREGRTDEGRALIDTFKMLKQARLDREERTRQRMKKREMQQFAR